MSIDVFGHSLEKTTGNRGPPGIGFKITDDGQFNIDNKRLCNVGSPIQPNDAVNLNILNEKIETLKSLIDEKVESLKSLIDEKNKFIQDLVEAYRDDVDTELQKAIPNFYYAQK